MSFESGIASISTTLSDLIVESIRIVSIRISPISYLTVPALLLTISTAPVLLNLKIINLPVFSSI